MSCERCVLLEAEVERLKVEHVEDVETMVSSLKSRATEIASLRAELAALKARNARLEAVRVAASEAIDVYHEADSTAAEISSYIERLIAALNACVPKEQP